MHSKVVHRNLKDESKPIFNNTDFTFHSCFSRVTKKSRLNNDFILDTRVANSIPN